MDPETNNIHALSIIIFPHIKHQFIPWFTPYNVTVTFYPPCPTHLLRWITLVSFVHHPLSLADTFHTNPQYGFEVTDADEDDEEEVGTVIIGLMQKDMRKALISGKHNLTIGYEIYQVQRHSSQVWMQINAILT